MLQLGVRELTASSIARVLGMMGRTHTGLGEQVALQVNICKANSGILHFKEKNKIYGTKFQSVPNSSSIWNDTKEKSETVQASTWNVESFVQVIQEMVHF